VYDDVIARATKERTCTVTDCYLKGYIVVDARLIPLPCHLEKIIHTGRPGFKEAPKLESRI
jgi:hypothetical protein